MFLRANLQNSEFKAQPVKTLKKYMGHVKLPVDHEVFEEVSKQLHIILFGKGGRGKPRLKKGTQF